MASRERHAGRTDAAGRAIIDIGSNTVRLVIYGGPPRAPVILYNEKVTARLGKGVAENGMLGQKSSALALSSLARYHALLKLRGVQQIDVVATAAARDARNGPAFLDKVRAIGFDPRLLSGEEEAITSAHGVLGAFPGAHGIVGDLGGGSLELVDIDTDGCRHGVSMPLGTLRLPAMRADGDSIFQQRIARALGDADWTATPGATLYLVGGSMRAFARHCMTVLNWPIDDTHGFELPALDALRLARALSRKTAETLTPLPGVASSRLAGLPNTAALLGMLIQKLEPARLVFSSWGLREGLLCEQMAPSVRMQDPLIAGVSSFVDSQGVPPSIAAMVAGWTAAANTGNGPVRGERLRLAATMLCLASARIEPNLRAEHARDWALRKRWIGIGPEDRAMLATAILANSSNLGSTTAFAGIASPERLREAQAWGLATRLCRRFSGCSAQGLSGSSLTVDDGALVLTVQPDLAVLVNEGVSRDLKAIAAHLKLRPLLR